MRLTASLSSPPFTYPASPGDEEAVKDPESDAIPPFFQPYTLNRPVKAPLSQLKNISFPTNKAERRALKIATLQKAFFPINDRQLLESLFDKIGEIKKEHLAGPSPTQPSAWDTTIEGIAFEIDIYPIHDDSSNLKKLRHEIFVSFAFANDGSILDREKHLDIGLSKMVGFCWLASKQPKRLVRTTTHYMRYGTEGQENLWDQKHTAHTECKYLSLFNQLPGFPKTYKCAEFDGAKSIVIMKHYFLDLFYFINQAMMNVADGQSDTLDDFHRIQLAIDVVAPIATLHEQRIAHQDIKPENYLVTNKRSLVLCDFGLAHHLDEEFQSRGTCLYMPWEKLQAHYTPDKYKLSESEILACDIWSAGLTLLFVISSHTPEFFNALDDALTKRSPNSTFDQAWFDMQDFFDDEPRQEQPLHHLVWEMLHQDPEQRPTAAEVLERLRQIQHTYSPVDKTYSLGGAYLDP